MSEQEGSQTSKLGVAAQATTSAAASLVTNSKKENAVDAGLVSDSADKSLASVSGTTGTGAGALSGAAGGSTAPAGRAGRKSGDPLGSPAAHPSGTSGAALDSAKGAPTATGGAAAIGRRGAYKSGDPLGSLVSHSSGTAGAALDSAKGAAKSGPAVSVGAGKAPATGRRAAYKAADPKLSMISNSTKGNAVDAGLVKKKTDSALATVGKSGSPSSAAIGAVKGNAAVEVAAAAADPLKKRIMSAGAAGLATAAEAGFSLNSDDAGVQALEDTRHGAVTGAKGALRATKKARKKLKVGHAARKGKDAARKAKGTSSLVSNNGKGKVGKIASRSAAKKAAQMQKVMQARRVAMVSKAATSTGIKAVLYKVVAAIMSAIAAALPILAVILTIITVIALIVIIISMIISFFTGWLSIFQQHKGSYRNLTGNEKVVAQFLSEKGLSTMQIAGIMGSIKGENEAYDPTLLQEVGDCPGGNYDNYPEEWISDDNVGYGICQWSAAGRSQGLVDYAAEQGKNSGDINIQAEYLWIELNGNYQASVLDPILEATSVEEICLIWSQHFEVFEGASDINNESNQKRIGYAQDYLATMTSGASSDLVSWAESKLTLPYELGSQGVCQNGTGREEYDCSGFVDQGLYECGYGDIFYDESTPTHHGPDTTKLYSIACEHWEEISDEEAGDGDIIFFFGSKGCFHVAFATSDGMLIEEAGNGVHDSEARKIGRWTGEAGNKYFRPSPL